MDRASGDGDHHPESNPHTPWYRGTTNTELFILSRIISSKEKDAPPFRTTAVFPWNSNSLDTLWDGRHVQDQNTLARWKDTIEKWQGAMCVGSTGYLVVFPHYASGKSKPFKFAIDIPTEFKGQIRAPSECEVRCAAWALSRTDPTEPLIIFTLFNLIFIVHVNSRKVYGRIRGHGGEITSIAVHPRQPYLFCTTSKDMTTRVHDVTLTARQKPNNLPWPPSQQASLAGPAFGLMSSESEGDGRGRCVAVCVGGRSGGHQAAVFAAAFHPLSETSLIATCGMDRCVKIWRIPPTTDPDVEDTLAREDKPLFSTDLIHKARVLSITWLSQDVLISHSAPAIMRREDSDADELYEEHGTVVVWRWLGFDRFFPPGETGKPLQKVVRGCASDYRGSQSFKIIASYSLPMLTRYIHVHHHPWTHDPILLVPDGSTIHILNITQFKPRSPPSFPLDNDNQELPELTKRMSKTQVGKQAGGAEGGDEDAGNAENTTHKRSSKWPQIPPPKHLLESVPGWKISVEIPKMNSLLPDIDTCEIAAGGAVILGLGERGTLYIWKLAEAASQGKR